LLNFALVYFQISFLILLFLQLNNLVQSLSCLRKDKLFEKIVDDQEKK